VNRVNLKRELECAQINDSGEQMLQQLTGKSLYPSGKHQKSLEHESSIPAGEFPVNSCQLTVLSSRNLPENCFKVPAIFGVFLPEPTRTS